MHKLQLTQKNPVRRRLRATSTCRRTQQRAVATSIVSYTPNAPLLERGPRGGRHVLAAGVVLIQPGHKWLQMLQALPSIQHKGREVGENLRERGTRELGVHYKRPRERPAGAAFLNRSAAQPTSSHWTHADTQRRDHLPGPPLPSPPSHHTVHTEPGPSSHLQGSVHVARCAKVFEAAGGTRWRQWQWTRRRVGEHVGTLPQP